MQKESTAVLLRIFIGESDKFKGKSLYPVSYTHLDVYKRQTGYG